MSDATAVYLTYCVQRYPGNVARLPTFTEALQMIGGRPNGDPSLDRTWIFRSETLPTPRWQYDAVLDALIDALSRAGATPQTITLSPAYVEALRAYEIVTYGVYRGIRGIINQATGRFAALIPDASGGARLVYPAPKRRARRLKCASA